MNKGHRDNILSILEKYSKARPSVIWYDPTKCMWFSYRSVPFPMITDEQLATCNSHLDLPIRLAMSHLRFELGFNI